MNVGPAAYRDGVTRYVVLGAGAVGGGIGARLHQSGADVVLLARGHHLQALRSAGLRMRTPEEDVTLRVPVVAGPDEIELRSDDVLVLATKTQQAQAVLSVWGDLPVRGGGTAGERLPILLATNGVACEDLALRYFARVHGVCVWMWAAHLSPGEVVLEGVPWTGVFHLGPVPAGIGRAVPAGAGRAVPAGAGRAVPAGAGRAVPAGAGGAAPAGAGGAAPVDPAGALPAGLAADWERARLRVVATDDVMRWKYRKLLTNVGNAFQALLGQPKGMGRLVRAAEAEGRGVLDAAGIDYVDEAEEAAERADSFEVLPVPGLPGVLGGSTWQSLTRGTGDVETDYLNGELVRIARLHGREAPINARLATLVRQAAATGTRPGAMSLDDLTDQLRPWL